jgi:predicted metalloprotease with PDZ domain
MAVGLAALCVASFSLPRAGVAAPAETFSIDYVVTIGHEAAVAHVRWELSGIEEIHHIELRFDPRRIDHLEGSGRLEPTPAGTVRWTPDAPYAHLAYDAVIDHVRGQHHRYDSYMGPDWVATRARDLFPRTVVDWSPRGNTKPKSRARLIFRLPSGWQSATAFPAVSKNVYRLDQPGKVLDRPRGWFALGKIDVAHQEIGGTMLQVARAPGSALNAGGLFQFLEATLPALQKLLGTTVEALLLVSAPDPMWRGGLSGEQSFFVHGDRPLRTPDKTSPYLHELFHVLQPFKVAADADWIEEGLAEYYSLELQRRAGLVDAAAYVRALGYFQRFGLWNVNLTQQRDNAATNNSAPLVMYALDQRIQHATAGKRRLDDVVTQLAAQRGSVDTQRFQESVQEVAGKSFKKFFDRQVLNGIPPSLANLQ